MGIPGMGGAWWAAVYGVAQSWTRLTRLSSRWTSRRPRAWQAPTTAKATPELSSLVPVEGKVMKEGPLSSGLGEGTGQ